VPTSIGWRLAACNRWGVEGTLGGNPKDRTPRCGPCWLVEAWSFGRKPKRSNSLVPVLLLSSENLKLPLEVTLFFFSSSFRLDGCWGEGKDATFRSMPLPVSLHQRRQDNWQTLPFVPRVTGRRPMMRSSHPAASSNMEAHA
jgi:hypothetical protein